MYHLVSLVEHWLGMTNASGKTYLFWSGFFGDVSIIVAAVAFLRHRNCHVTGCWRVGRHHVAGTPYVTCQKHHPAIDGKPTLEDVLAAHREVSDGNGSD